MKQIFLITVLIFHWHMFSMENLVTINDLPKELYGEIFRQTLNDSNLEKLETTAQIKEVFLKIKKIAATNKLFCSVAIESLYLLFKKANKNFSRLHLAIQIGAIWWVKKNFEAYKNDCNEKDFLGRLPIMVAIENDDLLTTAFLFFKQAKNWTIYNKEGQLTDVFKILSKFEKSKRIRYTALLTLGTKPIFLAIEKGNKDLLEILLQVGADPNQVNSNGITPLIFCLNKDCRRKIDILKTLLKYNADVNLCSSSGYSPLMYAVRNTDVEAAQAFLANKATLNVINSAGETAFSLAKKSSDKRMLNLLANAYKT